MLQNYKLRKILGVPNRTLACILKRSVIYFRWWIGTPFYFFPDSEAAFIGF